MNKPKKPDYKKTLVRNTEQKIPKVTPVVTELPTKKSDSENHKKTEVNEYKKNEKKDLVHTKLIPKIGSPKLQSTLKLSKKMNEITLKPHKTKSISDVEHNKLLAVDEKVSRQVNFPYDQTIYKGLISLSCPSDKTRSPQTCSISRPPSTIQKDKEPVLSDFIGPRKKLDLHYVPCVKIECAPSIITSSRNNLRLHSLLQINNDT